jgi:hypothetical protein
MKCPHLLPQSDMLTANITLNHNLKPQGAMNALHIDTLYAHYCLVTMLAHQNPLPINATTDT